MRSKSISALVTFVAAALAVHTTNASASPVLYNFSTGPQQNFSTPDVRGRFTGPVTGSFVYDSAVPLTGQGASPAFGFLSASTYDGALVSITGSVDGRSFTDTSGGSGVASNDGFAPPGTPTSPVDLLQFITDPFQLGSGFPRSLSGFDIGGLRLINIRMFWIETLLPGTPDFLPSEALLPAPPTFTGRLVLDFAPTSFVPGTAPVSPTTFAFFDGLIVTRASVPAPETLPLLACALLAFGASFASQRKPTKSLVAVGPQLEASG